MVEQRSVQPPPAVYHRGQSTNAIQLYIVLVAIATRLHLSVGGRHLPFLERRRGQRDPSGGLAHPEAHQQRGPPICGAHAAGTERANRAPDRPSSPPARAHQPSLLSHARATPSSSAAVPRSPASALPCPPGAVCDRSERASARLTMSTMLQHVLLATLIAAASSWAVIAPRGNMCAAAGCTGSVGCSAPAAVLSGARRAPTRRPPESNRAFRENDLCRWPHGDEAAHPLVCTCRAHTPGLGLMT